MDPISVIVPVRNEGGRIEAMLRSVLAGRSCRFPIELVVVDDASTDGCCARLGEVVSNSPEALLTLRRLERWSGIPAARNRGAEAARYPIYLITDGNTRFPPGWDVPIRRAFTRSRLLAITIRDIASDFRGYGCQILLPSMGISWLPVPTAYGGYAPIAACTGTVIDRALFHRLGGFDETLPLYGAAEPEFSLRAWLSGYEIVGLADLELRHRFRPRAEHDAYLAGMATLQLANYLRFACYYLPRDLLARTCDHYRERRPEQFETVWRALGAGDVWRRRAALAHGLIHDFCWFAARFPPIWRA